MGFFRWSAPLFGRFADRWSDREIGWMADHLRETVTPGSVLLDLGGGTGALARRLAITLSCRVTVVDPSPEMLRYVPDHAGVVAAIGRAEDIPFPDGTFDGAVVSDAFHHFSDQDGAAREIARVVRPGGRVLVLEFDPRGLMRPIVWGEKLLGEPGTFMEPEEACRFFASHGIRGTCEKRGRVSFWFMGRVEPKA